MTRDEDPARLLLAVLLGELDADDPRVQAAVAADPAFRRDLEDLLATQRLLDAAGAEERAVLRAASAAGAPPVDTAAILHRLAAAPRGGRTWPRILWLVGVAAALTLAVLWWRGNDADADAPRVPSVLGEEIEILDLLRDGERFHLRWRGSLGGGEYHRARVLDATGAELLHSDGIRGHAWTFPADEPVDLPSRVTVEVATYGVDGMLRRAPARRTLDVPRSVTGR